MTIDKATVAKVSHLARIKTTDEEREHFAKELNNIMQWIEQLSEVDTDGIEPMTSVVDVELYKRKDEVTDGGIQDKILKNAPETTEGFFVVPKVLG